MTILHSVILGIIQGLAEFLPVSSSGHLVIVSAIYKILSGEEFMTASQEEIFTDIILHLGTLIAVVFYFRKDIADMLKAFFTALKTKDFSSLNAKMPLYLVVGTIFTIIIAYPLNEFCETLVSSPVVVGIFLLITGFILFLSEEFSKKTQNDKECTSITWKQVIIIGVAQGIAACPGLSRSGMTICSGLMTGLNRVTAARYSFLLSILIILGASVFYPILKIETTDIMNFNWVAIFTGFLFSMFVGYFCVKYFMQFLNKYSMKCFAYYCWVIGIITVCLFKYI